VFPGLSFYGVFVGRLTTESPFLRRHPVRLNFGTMLIMLLMVVGAGVSLLCFYALRVPAITQELNAWLGRPDAVVDRGAARQAQVTFALFVYSAPLALGILVYAVHFIVNTLNRASSAADSKDDDQFRMD
jgi:sterol desaturase/sphingolipid hydroxylase (fatty acid hydroxylase superfamily)